MTVEADNLFNALVGYIDAAIEAKIDSGDSADGGLLSSVQKHQRAEKLRDALRIALEETP